MTSIDFGPQKQPASLRQLKAQHKRNMSEIIPVVRPDWDTYFLMIADVVSLRSMDAQTKVGAVLVNDKKFILGTGYNSFPPGMKDDEIPNTRPGKYAIVTHAEANCIINSNINLHHEKGLTLYTTIRPCLGCLKLLSRYDIKRLVFLDIEISANTGADQFWFDTLIKEKKISLEKIATSRLEGYNNIARQ